MSHATAAASCAAAPRASQATLRAAALMAACAARTQVSARPGHHASCSCRAAAQTAAILEKIDAILAEAGTDKSRLLSCNIWLRDIGADFAAMNEVWCEWVDPENKPARATVQAEMARPAILVEIQVTAAV